MTNRKEDWISEAPCARPVETDNSEDKRMLDFHSSDPEEQARAKALCAVCPFRRQCLQFAYDGKERFGIFGGVDEEELRKNQAINSLGEAHVSKDGRISCAFCQTGDTENLEIIERKRTRSHIKCTVCGLNWWARKAINAKLSNF